MYRELPPEDEQLGHLLLIHDWMTEQGFEHYEISNFAKPGKQARHNLAYWKRLGYLGLGPSAHSFDPGQGTHGSRWKNVSSLHKYSRLVEERKLPIEWRETLTAAEADLEKWMLALRLAEGFPTFWLDTPSRQSKAEQLILENLLQSHPEKPNYLQLTSRGFALSDQVIAALA
jgi:oxygen-independent coproporphyrinogen-3 oxidase